MRLPALGLVAVFLAACAEGSAAAPPPESPATPSTPAPPAAPLGPGAVRDIVDAPDRTPEDRKLDATRHPAELLTFLALSPGMVVADLGAGGGYTTELLARAVGPSGKVYGHNDPDLLRRFLERIWAPRLALPADKNVVRVDLPFDDPLPPEAKNLDAVVMFLFYHDTVWIGVDREKMNRAVFEALRPGGKYVVVDASAQDGHGTQDAKTLHRIEQSVVEAEVQKAGFRIASRAEFLRNPSDARDWSSSPRDAGDRMGTEDRFVVKFVKP
jgi:predicted methyltransferase